MTYAGILPHERAAPAGHFLQRAVAWFAKYGVAVEGVMTDKGSAFISRQYAAVCGALGLRHIRTHPYTPLTNGKVERMIQTLLREWAYRFTTAAQTSAHDGFDPTCTSATSIAVTLP